MTVALKLDTEKMIARKEGAIGWMIFNNPARRNALSIEMWRAMTEIIDSYGADDEVRVVVMTGAGDKAFISGADISEFEKHRASAVAEEEYNRITVTAQEALGALEKPLVAMIHGFCVGGGRPAGASPSGWGAPSPRSQLWRRCSGRSAAATGSTSTSRCWKS